MHEKMKIIPPKYYSKFINLLYWSKIEYFVFWFNYLYFLKLGKNGSPFRQRQHFLNPRGWHPLRLSLDLFQRGLAGG